MIPSPSFVAFSGPIWPGGTGSFREGNSITCTMPKHVTTDSEFKSGSLHQNDYLIYPVVPGLGMPQGIISRQKLAYFTHGRGHIKTIQICFLEDHLRFVEPDHRGSIDHLSTNATLKWWAFLFKNPHPSTINTFWGEISHPRRKNGFNSLTLLENLRLSL